jgi:SPFH domain / Band 7 family
MIHAVIVLAVLAAAAAYSALFRVHQTEQALLLRFGEPVRVIMEPGLNTKWPFIDRVITIDRRVLDLEAPVQEVQPLTRPEFPDYKKACFVDRPIRLATEEGCQVPPLGDLMPCLFRAAAIDRSVVAPCN